MVLNDNYNLNLHPLTLDSLVFAELVSYAENELFVALAVRVRGCVRGARHPLGTAFTSPPPPSLHHPVGRRAGKGRPPPPPHLHLPRKPVLDEKLRGAPELRGPLLPLSGVHQSSLGAGAVHAGGTVGVALTGKGVWFCLYG